MNGKLNMLALEMYCPCHSEMGTKVMGYSDKSSACYSTKSKG